MCWGQGNLATTFAAADFVLLLLLLLLQLQQ
jgi:hypothetical protein